MAEPLSSGVPRGAKIALVTLVIILVGIFAIDRVFQAGINMKALRDYQPPMGDMISVSGTGKVTATPDIGVVSLSVESRGASASAVLADNASKMNAIQAYLKGLGIEPKDLKTHSFNLYPNQTYNPQTGKQSIDGYVLSQGLEVKIRKLDIVGQVLSGGIERGANQIGQLSFTIDEPEKLQQQARLEAIANARAKAEELAKAAGVELGRVRTFSENDQPWNPAPMYSYAEKAMGGGGGDVASIEAGSQDITASVMIGFEIRE